MTDTCKKAAVIGWPIHHSRSPLIHGYWLKEHMIKGSYQPLALSPEKADAFFSAFAQADLVGANVTIPHKERVMAHLDHLDAAAQAIGAVNTIWLDEGRLCGTNTDWLGFLGNLDASSPGWDKHTKTALVLGAGGAARGVIYALIQRGLETIHVANRTLTRAQEMQMHFGDKILPHDLSNAEMLSQDVDLIINTTSLGMDNNPPLDLTLNKIKPDCLVTDIVYSPLETPLLKIARSRGNKTIDGLGMLLHQAAPGFERWFGILPKVSHDLRGLVLKEMGLA